jgi:hypothetical protein
MEHYLIRATIIPSIITMIMDGYSMNYEEALDSFYTSATGASLSDDETGLYGQSSLYIYGLYVNEHEDEIS